MRKSRVVNHFADIRRVFTDKDIEIIRMVASGRTQKQIAALMDYRPGTVAYMVSRIAAQIPGEGRPAVRITRYYMSQHGAFNC